MTKGAGRTHSPPKLGRETRAPKGWALRACTMPHAGRQLLLSAARTPTLLFSPKSSRARTSRRRMHHNRLHCGRPLAFAMASAILLAGATFLRRPRLALLDKPSHRTSSDTTARGPSPKAQTLRQGVRRRVCQEAPQRSACARACTGLARRRAHATRHAGDSEEWLKVTAPYAFAPPASATLASSNAATAASS